jgi:hypothetical protein
MAVNGSTAKEIQVTAEIRITYQARTETDHSGRTVKARTALGQSKHERGFESEIG